MSEPAKDTTRSKYVFLKTILDPDDRRDGAQCLLDVLAANSTGWSIVWARHDHAETSAAGSSPTHYHAVIRFASTESWSWLRSWLHDHDGHEYCAAGRGWQRCVRYLLHLDSPDKPVIPRSNLQYRGEITEDEISMLLGRPRASLLADIRLAPHKDTFGLVDWLVNERGHTPGEVAQMLRCIMEVNRYVGPISLLARTEDIPKSFAVDVDRSISPPGETCEGDDGLPNDLGCLPSDLFWGDDPAFD